MIAQAIKRRFPGAWGFDVSGHGVQWTDPTVKKLPDGRLSDRGVRFFYRCSGKAFEMLLKFDKKQLPKAARLWLGEGIATMVGWQAQRSPLASRKDRNYKKTEKKRVGVYFAKRRLDGMKELQLRQSQTHDAA